MELTRSLPGYDEGLRRYMIGIYNIMLAGLLASAGAAWLSISTGFVDTLKDGGLLFWVVLLAPLGLIFAMGAAMRRASTTTLFSLYGLFVVLEGLGLSVVLSRYTGGSITTAFLVASAGFAGLSLYGYTTKKSLAGLGTVMVFGLFGLIALMIVNLFIRSSGLDILICLAGLGVFGVLTAWDTQKLKDAYDPHMSEDATLRMSLWGAIDLYLDFLNIFLFLLRLLGQTSDD